MNIHVRVKVKFRAFGITFGQVDKQWSIGVINGNVTFVEEPVQVPTDARVLFDRQGLKVNAWA